MPKTSAAKPRVIHPDQILIPVEEVARLLACSRASLFKAIDAGRIPRSVDMGPKIRRWSRVELEMWAAAGAPSQEIWEKLRERLIAEKFLGGVT